MTVVPIIFPCGTPSTEQFVIRQIFHTAGGQYITTKTPTCIIHPRLCQELSGGGVFLPNFPGDEWWVNDHHIKGANQLRGHSLGVVVVVENKAGILAPLLIVLVNTYINDKEQLHTSPVITTTPYIKHF